jgi:hypothetical protein
MKKLYILIPILLIQIALRAQESFFPTKTGTVLTYKTYDKKDKLQGTTKYTVKNVVVNGSNIDITYQCESLDAKDKFLFKEDIIIHQKDGVLYMDMSNYINKASFQQNGEIPASVEIKGNNMEIPVNPKPGDQMKDAKVEMAMKMGFVSVKMIAELTNRKVEAYEDVTVKSGTYKSYKFLCDFMSSAMGIKTSGKSISWYAKGIGTIKTESYSKDGVLLSRTELVEVK